MLFLTPIVTPELLEKSSADELTLSFSQMEEVFEEIWAVAGDRNAKVSVTVGAATDELGTSYEDVALVITGRFKRNHERFLLSGDVAVSLEGLMDTLHEMYAHFELS